MKARRFSNGRAREGYVSLLAITFAFGLATLGTAVAVTVRSYINAAASQERAILDRMALETAANLTIGRMSATGALTLLPGDAIVAGERRMSVTVSMPMTKVDPDMDSQKEVGGALQAIGLSRAIPRFSKAGRTNGLAAFASSLGLTAAEEDCARRVLTFGRAPAARQLEPSEEGQLLSPGDQVRAELLRSEGRTVLWTRVRFTGSETTPWLIHDYRLLQNDAQACELAKDR